jgi:hypothetical protein
VSLAGLTMPKIILVFTRYYTKTSLVLKVGVVNFDQKMRGM